MFVYLDNAHFSALEALLRQKPDAFIDFLAFWLEHDCKLIVSRAHLHEIGQHEDERDLERRLELLRYFSIWSGDEHENVDWVIIREMLQQALFRLQPDAASPAAAYLPLRAQLYRSAELSSIATWLRSARPALLHEMRTRREMARFENSSRELRNLVRDIINEEPKWSPDAWKMMPVVEKITPKVAGDPVGDLYNATVKARMRECYQRAKKERQALRCMYGLEGFACADAAPKQDLSRLGFYRVLAQHWVLPYYRRAGHDAAAVQAVLDQLNLYDAPGISGALAVERGRKLHHKEWEPGDYMDADHVLWAAHADLAFLDKRTYGFLQQAKTSRDMARLLSPHLRVRFERTTTLEDVKKHIITLAKERSGTTN
jgi:hypothetical protein